MPAGNRTVRLAAVLMSFYAVFLVVEAVGVVMMEGRLDAQHFVVHVLGAAVWALVVVALLRGRRWAWLAVIAFGCIMIAAVAVALILAWSSGVPMQTLARHLGHGLRLGAIGLPLGALSVAALGASVVLLLRKEARQVFRPLAERGQ
jgi:hypothetical protein